MTISIISFTRKGGSLNERLCGLFKENGLKADGYSIEKYAPGTALTAFGDLKDLIKKLFKETDGIIFISASGIAVRAISPFLISKDADPAVLVIDEEGKYVISLLSGHIGGANALCKQAAELIKALPVITTATDVNEKFAVDTWAVRNHLLIPEITKIKAISSAILNGEKVGFFSEYKMEGQLPTGITFGEAEVGICILNNTNLNPFPVTLHLIPKNLVVGIGCKRDTSYEKISKALEKAFDLIKEKKSRINKICSIDLKQEEPGLLKLAEAHKVPFVTFTAEELKVLEGDFTASPFVEKTTGVDNVCERSACLGSDSGKCLMKKMALDGVTVAVYELEYTIRFE